MIGGRLSDADLLLYVEGQLTPAEAEAIDAAVHRSADLAERTERLKTLLGRLRQTDPALEQLDLVGNLHSSIEQAAMEQPDGQPRHRRFRQLLGAGLGLAATALLVFGLITWLERARVSDEQMFRAKSAGEASVLDRFAGIQVYRWNEPAPAEPLGPQLSEEEALVFSYTNIGPQPFAYLMIFAIDQHGEVFWYYPAREQPSDDPAGIQIRAVEAVQVPLPDAIKHDFPAAGRLVLYGVFSHQPLRCSTVEQAIRQQVASGHWSAAAPERLPLPLTGQHILSTEVTR